MVSLGKMVVTLATESDAWVRGMKTAKTSTQEFTATIKGQLSSGVKAFLGATVGVGSLTGALALSVKEAMKDEKALTDLRAALAAAGANADTLSGQFAGFADRLAATTRYTQEEIMGIEQLAVSIGGLSGRQIPEATRTAIGLARALNVDLEAALRLTIKAMNGNYASLAKLLPELRNVKEPAEQWAILAKKAAEGLEAEARAMDSTAGAFASMKKEMGEFLSTLGEPFLKPLKAAAQGFADFLRDIRRGYQIGQEELYAGVRPLETPRDQLLKQRADLIQERSELRVRMESKVAEMRDITGKAGALAGLGGPSPEQWARFGDLTAQIVRLNDQLEALRGPSVDLGWKPGGEHAAVSAGWGPGASAAQQMETLTAILANKMDEVTKAVEQVGTKTDKVTTAVEALNEE